METNTRYRLKTYDIVFMDAHNIEREVRYHEYSENDARKEARREGAVEIISVRATA